MSHPHQRQEREKRALRLPRQRDESIEATSTEFEDYEDGDPILPDPDAWDDDEWEE